MDNKLRLEMEITDEILKVARLFNEVDNSDLQGIAQATAQKIMKGCE